MYLPHLLMWFVNFSDPCVFPCGVCPCQEPRRSRRSPVVHPDLQRHQIWGLKRHGVSENATPQIAPFSMMLSH